MTKCNLGLCNANGDGVAEDPEKAAEWFHKAAERGDECARQELALLEARPPHAK
ncbi:MAG: SEL1-like repeat protein [Lentisphaerota bacterium]